MKWIFFAILFATSVAGAKPSNKEITYLGTWDCGQWRETARKHDEVVRQGYLMWLTGFLSGTAIALDRSSMLNNISGSSIASWMDNYCQNNPLDKLIDGASELSHELALRDRNRNAK